MRGNGEGYHQQTRYLTNKYIPSERRSHAGKQTRPNPQFNYPIPNWLHLHPTGSAARRDLRGAIPVHTRPPPLPTKKCTNGTLTHTRTRSSPRRSWLDRFGWSKAVSRWAYLSCRVVGENNEGPAPPRAAQINGGGPLKKIWYLSCQATINCATLSTEHNGHDVPPTTPISTLCSGGGSTLPRAASLIIVRSAQ